MKIKIGQKIIDKIRGKEAKRCEKKYEYNFDLEWRQRLHKEIENINIYQNYKDLIRNLDDFSISVVSNFINRVIYPNEERFLTFYEEKNEELHTHLRYSTFKISDTCYAYHNYFLPVWCFCGNIFIDKLFLNEIKDLSKIRSKCIIDAGAYIGDSSLLLSEYTDKKVYAFEPVEMFNKHIKETITLNEKNNIEPVLLSLDREEKEITANLQDGATSYVLENNSTNKINIKLTTLDNFVSKNNIEIGLIKVDIEGAEKNFLQGALKTITMQKPTLIISIYHSMSDFLA